jgi:uncharacterized protein (TIGR00255 family)
MPNVVAAAQPLQASAQRHEVLWPLVEPALDEALEGLVEMRRREGDSLRADFLARTHELSMVRHRIGELADDLPRSAQQKMEERIGRLVAAGGLDPQRLAVEVALLADRADISEELTRLGSHIAQLYELIDHSEPVGRKLEFLLQELLREVNTIGSKAQHIEVARLILDAKSELEKLREQVQNVE